MVGSNPTPAASTGVGVSEAHPGSVLTDVERDPHEGESRVKKVLCAPFRFVYESVIEEFSQVRIVWARFQSCVGCAKKENAAELEERINKQKSLRKHTNDGMRDLVYYVAFIVMFSCVTLLPFAAISKDAFFFISSINRATLNSAVPDPSPTFNEVRDSENFWRWFQGPYIYSTFGLNPWDGSEPPPIASGHTPGNFLGGAQLVGKIRIRQLRVEPDSCKIKEAVKGIVKECYGDYDTDTSDNISYNWVYNRPLFTDGSPSTMYDPGWLARVQASNVATAFEYRNKDTMRSGFSTGRIETHYHGDGYAIDLSVLDVNDGYTALDIAAELYGLGWIDAQTRVVFMEYSLYSPSNDLILAVRLTVEVHASGAMRPQASYYVFELHPLESKGDIALVVIHALLLLMVLGLVMRDILKILSGDRTEMRSVFFLISAVSNILLMIAISMHFYGLSEVDDLDPKPDEFFNVHDLAEFLYYERNILSVVAMLCWFRVFNYTSSLPRFGLLGRTLGRALPAIFAFVLMSFVVFLGFAQAYYMGFFATVEGFQSLGESMVSLLRFSIGDYDYDAMQAENRVLAPILFVCMLIVVFFVWVNVVIAIVSNAYDVERELIEEFIFDEEFEDDKFGVGMEYDGGAAACGLTRDHFHRYRVHSLREFHKDKAFTIDMTSEQECLERGFVTNNTKNQGVYVRQGPRKHAGHKIDVIAVYFLKKKHTQVSASKWWAENSHNFLVGHAIAHKIKTGFKAAASMRRRIVNPLAILQGGQGGDPESRVPSAHHLQNTHSQGYPVGEATEGAAANDEAGALLAPQPIVPTEGATGSGKMVSFSADDAPAEVVPHVDGNEATMMTLDGQPCTQMLVMPTAAQMSAFTNTLMKLSGKIDEQGSLLQDMFDDVVSFLDSKNATTGAAPAATG